MEKTQYKDIICKKVPTNTLAITIDRETNKTVTNT
jgi:hypothetical protein